MTSAGVNFASGKNDINLTMNNNPAIDVNSKWPYLLKYDIECTWFFDALYVQNKDVRDENVTEYNNDDNLSIVGQ